MGMSSFNKQGNNEIQCRFPCFFYIFTLKKYFYHVMAEVSAVLDLWFFWVILCLCGAFFALKFVVASELILCFSIFFFGVKPCATSMIQDFKCIHHYPYINRILSLYTHDVSLWKARLFGSTLAFLLVGIQHPKGWHPHPRHVSHHSTQPQCDTVL